MVRRRYSIIDKPRKLFKIGIRVRCTRREAPISRRSRTKSLSYTDIFNDWLFRSAHLNAETHSYASFVWCFPLHGRCFTEGSPILRPTFDHADARQVSARLHVSSTSKDFISFMAYRKLEELM